MGTINYISMLAGLGSFAQGGLADISGEVKKEDGASKKAAKAEEPLTDKFVRNDDPSEQQRIQYSNKYKPRIG